MTTSIYIHDVESVHIEKRALHLGGSDYVRYVRVIGSTGDRFELVLFADEPSALDLKQDAE